MAKKSPPPSGDDEDEEEAGFLRDPLLSQSAHRHLSAAAAAEAKVPSRNVYDEADRELGLALVSAAAAGSAALSVPSREDVVLLYDQLDEKRHLIFCAILQICCVTAAVLTIGSFAEDKVKDKSFMQSALYMLLLGAFYALTRDPAAKIQTHGRRFLPERARSKHYNAYARAVAQFKAVEPGLTPSQMLRFRKVLNDLEDLLNTTTAKNLLSLETKIEGTLKLLECMITLVARQPAQRLTRTPASTDLDKVINTIASSLETLEESERDSLVTYFLQPLIYRLWSNERIPVLYPFLVGMPSTGKSTFIKALTTALEGRAIIWTPDLNQPTSSGSLFSSSIPFDVKFTHLLTQAVLKAKEAGVGAVVIVLEELSVHLAEKSGAKEKEKDKDKKKKKGDEVTAGEGEDLEAQQLSMQQQLLAQFEQRSKGGSPNIVLKTMLLEILGGQIDEVDDRYIGMRYELEGVQIFLVATGNEWLPTPAIQSRFMPVVFPKATLDQLVPLVIRAIEKQVAEIAADRHSERKPPTFDFEDPETLERLKADILALMKTEAIGDIGRKLIPAIVRKWVYGEQLSSFFAGTKFSTKRL